MVKTKDFINVKGLSIQIYTDDFINDYISLTDIARFNVITENSPTSISGEMNRFFC